MAKQDRRLFLKKCARLGALAAAGSAAPVRGLFGKDQQDNQVLSLGKLAELQDGKRIRVEKAVRVGDGKTVKSPKLVVMRKGDRAYVMSARCTHAGCEVSLLPDGSTFCPCHKSTFDKNGLVTKGPAKRPLDWYAVEVEETGDVRVNLGKTIGKPTME